MVASRNQGLHAEMFDTNKELSSKIGDFFRLIATRQDVASRVNEPKIEASVFLNAEPVGDFEILPPMSNDGATSFKIIDIRHD